MQGIVWSDLGRRARQAAVLDEDLFREVAEDPRATGPALAVVLAVALAEGLGRLPGGGLEAFAAGVVQGALGWLLWLVSVQALALASGLGGDFGRLFRALGFASLPFGLALFEAIPVLGLLASTAKWTLGLVAFVVALRCVLEVETRWALALAVGGLVAAILLSLPVAWAFGL